MLVRLYKTNTRLLRYVILPILALVLTHLVAYKKLPYEAGYEFPTLTFSFILLICAICCETNFVCYHSIKKYFTKQTSSSLKISHQLFISGLLTAVVFGFLIYSINYFIFGIITPLTRFLSSLLIAELIILLETLYFITRDLYLTQEQNITENGPKLWQIHIGKKIQMVSESEIAYLYSQAGLVYLITFDGQKILTQFNSFNDVKGKYDLCDFFQVNRQYMVKLKAIETVMKEVNQKLKIKLNPQATEIPQAAMISRYRSVEFKKWMAQ